MKNLHKIALGALALAIVAAPAWGAPQTRVDERRDANPDMHLEIDGLIVGSLEIVGWDRNEMTVTGTLGADVEEFEIDGDPGDWEISVDWPDHDWDGEDGRHRNRHNDVDVDLVIQVPRGASLEISTVTAPIKVRDVNGRIELEAVTGNIEYSGSATRLDLSAVTGSIEVESATIERGDFETVQGSIRFSGDFDRSGHFSFESTMGGIELALPESVAAEFDIETIMGDVVNELGPEAKSSSRWMPSKELRFSTNGGGAKVSLETLQGKIEIRKR